MAYTPITTIMPNTTAKKDKLKELISFLQSDINNQMTMDKYKKGLVAETLQNNYMKALTESPESFGYPNVTADDIRGLGDIPAAAKLETIGRISKTKTQELLQSQKEQVFNQTYDNLIARYPKYKSIIETRRLAGDDPSLAISEIEQYEYRRTSPKSEGGKASEKETENPIFPKGNRGFMYFMPTGATVPKKIAVVKKNGKWVFADKQTSSPDLNSPYWLAQDSDLLPRKSYDRVNLGTLDTGQFAKQPKATNQQKSASYNKDKQDVYKMIENE